ncbi:hypothetical protein KCU93_g36, partial [Aureobasidium melanogenum]
MMPVRRDSTWLRICARACPFPCGSLLLPAGVVVWLGQGRAASEQGLPNLSSSRVMVWWCCCARLLDKDGSSSIHLC